MATKASKKKPPSPASNPQRDMFVIMPFSGSKSCTEEQWTDIFENVFSPAAEAAGLSCSRAKVSTGSLIKSIVERLRTSYIVLADITDANPNVFYELGVRHSLSKRTIIVAQGASHIPSDLRGYWSLIYGTEPRHVKKFAEDLKGIVDHINAEPERPDNPVSDYLEREFVQSTRIKTLDAARRFSALHTELTGILGELSGGRFRRYPSSVGQHSCLSLLLDERYIDPGPELLRQAYEARKTLRVLMGCDEPSSSFVADAISMVSALMNDVRVLRDKLAKGDYSEPEQISVLNWSFSASTNQPQSPLKTREPSPYRCAFSPRPSGPTGYGDEDSDDSL